MDPASKEQKLNGCASKYVSIFDDTQHPELLTKEAVIHSLEYILGIIHIVQRLTYFLEHYAIRILGKIGSLRGRAL